MKKQIIVTGANGFLGANLCNHLKKKGFDISCLVREKANITLLNKNHKIYCCDYNDKASLEKILRNFDVVIHLAALTKAKNFQSFYDVNVALTKDIVNIVNKSNKCKYFIFMSSQAAVGPSKGMCVKVESDIEAPISWYGISKYLAENIVKQCQKKWTIIRPSSIYGEGDKDFLFFFKMINCNIAPITGKFDKYISLIYVGEIVEIIRNILCNYIDYNDEEYMNLLVHASDGYSYKIEEFISILSSALKKRCFTFRVSDNSLLKLSNILDFFYNFTDKVSILNSQKAIELTQENWLIDNKKPLYEFHAKGIKQIATNYKSKMLNNNLYVNLRKTYLWYQKNGYL